MAGKREEKGGKSGGGFTTKDRIVMSEGKLVKKGKIRRMFRKADNFSEGRLKGINPIK